MAGQQIVFADIQAPPQSDQGPTRKLGRGLSNLLFAPTEIIDSMSHLPEWDMVFTRPLLSSLLPITGRSNPRTRTTFSGSIQGIRNFLPNLVLKPSTTTHANTVANPGSDCPKSTFLGMEDLTLGPGGIFLGFLATVQI